MGLRAKQTSNGYDELIIQFIPGFFFSSSSSFFCLCVKSCFPGDLFLRDYCVFPVGFVSPDGVSVGVGVGVSVGVGVGSSMGIGGVGVGVACSTM